LWQTESYSLEYCQSLQDVLTFLAEYLMVDLLDQTQIQLKEVILTNTQHLGEEFNLAYESGELSRFLQEKLLIQSMDSIYIFQITIADRNY